MSPTINYQLYYERFRQTLKECLEISMDSTMTNENRIITIRDTARGCLDGEPTTADKHNNKFYVYDNHIFEAMNNIKPSTHSENDKKWNIKNEYDRLYITMNEKDEKRLCTMEKILVPTVFDPSITFSIYKFKPTFIENPTKTSIQFEDKHFEDDIGRYINHNCDPNTKIIKLAKTDDIVLIPIKDIAINEEITINYNATEEKLSHPFKCDCHGKLIKGNKYGQNKKTCSRKEKD